MSGQVPEEEVQNPARRQRWHAMTFLHWRHDAEDVPPCCPMAWTSTPTTGRHGSASPRFSVPTVLGASSLYGVPYRYADMWVEEGDVVRLSQSAPGQALGRPRHQRRTGGSVPGPLRARPWLTGRWRAYSTIAGRLATVPVQHQPWDVWEATVVRLEQSLLTAEGLPDPDHEPLVPYSPGVDVRLGVPCPL